MIKKPIINIKPDVHFNVTRINLALTMALSFGVSQSVYAQFNNPIQLSDISNDINGQNGFVIHGENEYDNSGSSVSSAGDINGDGIDDLIIGANYADPNGNSLSGSSYIIFGSNSGFPNPLQLSTISNDANALNGFVVHGINETNYSGGSVSNAGDVNGDGIDDLIIGAKNAGPNSNPYAGSTYVVFGSNSGFSNPIQLSDIASDANGLKGFVIHGENNYDFSGESISTAGDVNGDGIDDIVIGAVNADANGNFESGSSYVIFGSNSGFPNPLLLSSIVSDMNGLNGIVIHGVSTNDFSGVSVNTAGDVNDDGIDDLIIGSSVAAEVNGDFQSGSAYVIYGSNSGLSNPIQLSDIISDVNGINGFVIYGANAEDFSGSSVSKAGDVNGDGIDDLIIGSNGADPNNNSFAGSTNVVFGSNSGFPNPLQLSSINNDVTGLNGFVIHGANAIDLSGSSVSAAGDVNDDGIDDIIIGAHGADSNDNSFSGSSYVIYGRDSGFPNPIQLSDINNNTNLNGFVIQGANNDDRSGESVSNAGDVNNDGIDDLIIGARGADSNGNSGSGDSYVVFGKSDNIFNNGFEPK